ncbi:MAG: DUF1249 domain-containing protein [Proteobacteria bacterium]|nr:DUF1249 domain-containing protein [Pseudomonadota bacterium]
MNDIHTRIYRHIVTALGQGDDPFTWPDAWKLEKSPYQPLHIDVLERGSDFVTIALAHYYEQNGDLVPDPDMTVRLYPKQRMAEALTFQNAYIYQEAYNSQNGKRLINLETKRQLNAFLLEWSRNLKTRFWSLNPE